MTARKRHEEIERVRQLIWRHAQGLRKAEAALSRLKGENDSRDDK